jgi:hypothetical protein
MRCNANANKKLTRCGTGPFGLDVCCPVCHEGRHDLALRPGLVQKLVIVRVTTLRYTCPFRREKRYILYDYRVEEDGRNERTDEHALTHKSAHLTTRVDRKPFTQNELQLVQHLVLVLVLVLVVIIVVAVVAVADVHVLRAPLKDRFGTQIMGDKVGRL